MKNMSDFFKVKINNLYLIGALTSKPYAFTARPWELERLDFVDFFDSNLSSISVDVRGLQVMRILPRINENLNEEWISDKIRFSYDGFRRQRLLHPYLLINGNYKEIEWEEAFFNFYFSYNLRAYDFINFSFLEVCLGKFMDFESLVSCKDFFSSFKESNIQFNYYKSKKNYDNSLINNFSLNLTYKDFDKLNFCLILGSNLRYENPLLHLKLLKASSKGLPIFSFMSSNTNKFRTLSFGNEINLLINFLNGKNKYSLILTKADNKAVLVSEVFRIREDLSFTKLLSFFRKMGFNISHVHSSSADMNFLGIGFGKDSYMMKKENNKFYFLYNFDDFEFKKDLVNSYIIYQGHHGDKGASNANLILPSTFFLEKKGSFLNALGSSFSNYRFVLRPASQIRTDWRIFTALSFYFFEKRNEIIIDFIELAKRSLFFIPFYNSKSMNCSFSYNIVESIKYNESILKINNTIGFSLFIDYYISDVVTRASKVMALTALRFKNNFFNF